MEKTINIQEEALKIINQYGASEMGAYKIQKLMEEKNKELASPLQIGNTFHLGLTKREYFAGQFLAAMLSTPENCNKSKYLVKKAIEITDYLLEELNK